MTESENGIVEIWSLLNIPHSKAPKAPKHFQETGTNEDRPERGRPRTANNAGDQKKFSFGLKETRGLKIIPQEKW
ncbi:hypothetical protein Y032_0238g3293 [Ancylostoma ceylanicum]|uniref:Uncharacterized protein n=1 Tax=Ancylostoma ceylanicum TaxID=53326 RepID=A0A016SF46_9BILA|nr:hypothetical protein Y032_0238g3293 [Ancylostoma ceylanicum]